MQDRTQIIHTQPADPEVVVTQPAATTAVVDQVEATSFDPYERRREAAFRWSQGIWLLFGLLEALLAIRFVLRLLGANQQADFARFMYGITTPFLTPFFGLFGTPQYGAAALEMTTIVAMLVYALIAWFLTKLVWIIMGDRRSATTTSASTVHTRTR